MGAEFIIAVDLNHDMLATQALKELEELVLDKPTLEDDEEKSEEDGFMKKLNRMGGDTYQAAVDRINLSLKSIENPALKQVKSWLEDDPLPNIFEVLLSSINIMETQITQTRLKLDKPDILIQPKLGHISFMEFSRADEIINIGYEEAKKQLQQYQG